MNRRFTLQPRKKSQTLPASTKPSSIHKKRSRLAHLSPKVRLSHDKKFSKDLTCSTPSDASGTQSPLPLLSPPVPSSPMASSNMSTVSSPATASATASASPTFASSAKMKDAAGTSDSIDDNQDENIEVQTSSNGADGAWNQLLAASAKADDIDLGSANSLDSNQTKAAIEYIQKKISRTKALIKAEQTARDENVDEYLQLASSCSDKQQSQRIKNVFEKKNQKSAQTVQQLQRKLENYQKKIQDLEKNGISSQAHHRQPKGVLRDVSQGISGVVGNIKGGLSGLSAATHTAAETVMSKPREFAHLIKNKFGSADNISSMSKTVDDGTGVMDETEPNNHHGSATFTHSTKYTSDDECSSVTSGSAGVAVVVTTNSTSPGHQAASAHEAPSSPSFPISSLPIVSTPVRSEAANNEMLVSIWTEIHERRDENQRLSDELESLKAQIQHDYSIFNQALQDERYRYERLEEQMNDLIELHQNEIENLKTGISDMEEKVQYQSEERLNDLHEQIESCQTRVSRMEHQQHQHQQLVSIEGIDNSNARAIVLKMINVVLTVLQVVLLLVSTIANIIMPLLTTRVRAFTTITLILIIVLVVQQWTHLVDKAHHFVLNISS